MKNKAVFYFLLLLNLSCQLHESENNPKKGEISSQKQAKERIVKDTPVTAPSFRLNFTDINGLKQGLWKTYWNKKIWKEERYKDGHLHGINREYFANGEIIQSKYINGVKHGLSIHYHPDSSAARFITLWDNDKAIWLAFPNILESSFVSLKGFILHIDSAKLEIPYVSGKLLYSGTIIKKEPDINLGYPIGIHKVFYETGELKALVDFDSRKLTVYDKGGEIIREEPILEWDLSKK